MKAKKLPYKDIKEFDEADLQIIADFLPSPNEMGQQLATRKITIALSNPTIAFFKAQARHLKVPYQKLVRELLDRYVAKASKYANS